MLTLLTHILNGYPDIEYKITEEKANRMESYYVKKQSETNRIVDVTHTYLTVYKTFSEDGKKLRGSASTEIHPTMTEAEIKEAAEEAIYAAGFVKNEYHPLVEKTAEPTAVMESELDKLSLTNVIEQLRDCVFAQDSHEKGYLSYSEFFVSQKDIRIVNSLGVDRAFRCYNIYMEMAATWKEDKEIEIYESYSMSDCNTQLLADRVKKLFTVAAQKPLAKMTPAVKDINVILTGECLREFFSYYFINANAMSVYNKISTFQAGDKLQGENVQGDLISMTADPFLPGSVYARPYDADGFPLKRFELIKDGELLRLWGGVRFSSYLDIEPTGSVESFVVSGGTHTVADLKKEPYLELVSFSDFQMDSTTGDFASEIRLGFYYDGNCTVPITGGSVSGNIKNVQGELKMSVETDTYGNYCGPSAVSMKSVSIAGC